MMQTSFHLGLFIQLSCVLQAYVHKLMACIFLAASPAFFNSSLQVCHSSLCEMAVSLLCPCLQSSAVGIVLLHKCDFHPKATLPRGDARGDCLFSPAHSDT